MNSNIRVCFVISQFHPIFSGQAIFIHRIIRKLQQKGVNASVLTARYKNLSKDDFIDGVYIHRVPALGSRNNRVNKLIFPLFCFAHTFLKGRIFNIIHLCGSTWFSSALFKLLGKNTIFEITLLGADDAETIKSRFGKPGLKLYSRADYFVSLSAALSKSYSNTNLPDSKIIQIPHGVDPEVFYPITSEQKQILRKKLDLQPAEKIVTFVGGIVKRKGVDFLIDAWAKVSTSYQNAILLLIGPFLEPDFLLEMRRKTQKIGIQDKVRFVGRVDNVHEYLKSSDAFAFCSHAEGMPSALIEAISCGLPCVVLKIDGITDDVFTHRIDGLVVEDQNINEYAESLLEVLRNDDLACQLGNNARKKVLEKFSIESICDRYIELYQKLING